MKTTLIAVAATLVGLALGWMLRSEPEPGSADPSPEAAAVADATEADARAATLERQREAAVAKTRELEAEIDLLRQQLARRDADAAAAQEEAAAAAASEPEDWREAFATTPFQSDETGPMLEGIDWVSFGENLGAMPALTAGLAEALRDGLPPPPEIIGKLQQHNGPLAAIALTLQGTDLPGTRANGRFTHPLVMGNGIAAALAAQELPLTAEQQEKLEALSLDYDARERARVAKYGADELELAKTVEEARSKDRFFDAAFALLTEEQASALRPEAAAGRIGIDLYSSGLVWQGVGQPIMHLDPATVPELVTSRLVRQFSLTDEAGVRDVVEQWVSEIPVAVVDYVPDALDQANMPRTAFFTDWAERTVDLLERVRQRGLVPDSSADTVREWPHPLIVLRNPQ